MTLCFLILNFSFFLFFVSRWFFGFWNPSVCRDLLLLLLESFAFSNNKYRDGSKEKFESL